MNRILMVASEATPFAKTGGLADVLGSLPRALRERGEEVAVVLPRYRPARTDGARRVFNDLRIWFGPDCHLADLYLAEDRGVPVYLVDCPPLFEREGLYGVNGEDYPDNHIRFAVLARAAIAVIRWLFRPQIVHCHDWQTALTPVYMRHLFSGDPTFYALKTLLTIHNLGYQGQFPKAALAEIGLDEALYASGLVECWGKVNLLKAGIVVADHLSTVSPTYAHEIQTPEFGVGLDALLHSRAGALTGILNGVDYAEWSPETDPHIPARYSAADLTGKAECKRQLLAEFGLPGENPERPLIGMVGRLVSEKAALVAEVGSDIAREDISMVVLGTGDSGLEQAFRELAEAHPDRIAVRIGFDNRLAHRIEAGSDLFLMPSRYEPCGLNQIYSLRYGTVPIVRATGGLEDTIDEGTGFKFSAYTGEALMGALRQALAAWKDRTGWRETMLRGMAKDYSWKRSAGEYSKLYNLLLNP